MSDKNNCNLSDIYGEIIHSYIRAQAIEDGFLIDVTNIAIRVGFKVPVAMTAAVWHKLEHQLKHEPSSSDARFLLCRLKFAIREKKDGLSDQILFEINLPFSVCGEDVKPNLHTFKAIMHGGDRGEPVVTIMMLDED